MSFKRIVAIALTLLILMLSPVATSAAPQVASSPVSSTPTAVRVFANCTALNKVYRHGIGRKGARDRVSGSSRPVTNFTVNTALYNANKARDRDKDGVACEKR